MKYIDLSLKEIHELLKNKTITPKTLVLETFERIESSSDLNAYITLNKEEALKQAEEFETLEVDNPLFGIPIAIKDNIVTKGLRTTAASRILDNFIPIYDATVIEKIKEKHMIIIGKTNMDEFGMGSASKTSYYGAPLNPKDKTKISGGSSGGSAVTVSNKDVLFALGTDTGGSIRQPSSYCGIVGMKPTYGRVSRFGLIAFASSLDQIGPMSRNVLENAHLLNILVGRDEKDLTSADKEEEDFTRFIGKDKSSKKIAVPNYFMSDVVSSDIKDKLEQLIKQLEEKGHTIDYIDIDYLSDAVTLYQIIAMAEASSNLARFDGIRYGMSVEDPKNINDLYTVTREKGFGEEVKRRIMVGSYLLSGENAVTYYNKALQIRSAMKKSFERVFEEYDFIIGPTTTTVARDVKKDNHDPREAFLDDVLVIPVNMAGLPALSLPMGENNGLPVGLQLIGNYFEEAKIYAFADYIEKMLEGERSE